MTFGFGKERGLAERWNVDQLGKGEELKW